MPPASGAAQTPVRILIAALGGEGGGVLAGWIADAAVAAGLWAQRTSIPGVAQRTGATTYYLEIVPKSDGARPVLALNPAPGRVDLMVSTELLETARMVQAGYVTPDRTVLIATRRRVYTVAEKAAMADGRRDPAALEALALRFSRRAMVEAYDETAARAGSAINAVLLGAISGSGIVPVDAERFRDAIRASGKAVEANLRGFEAGLARATAPDTLPAAATPAPAPEPAASPDVLAEARARLADYQDVAYVALFDARLARFAGRPGADPTFMDDLARLLARRMAFEDTIRVACLKLGEDRLDDVRAEAKAKPGDIVDVVEYLKPGPEEILSLLPPSLGRRALAFVERRGWSDAAWPMTIHTTRAGGFMRLKALAALRRWRPRSLRYADEQDWIEHWLDLVDRCLAVDPAAAREAVATAGLVKGYGDTLRRGHRNWRVIAEAVIEPGLDGRLPREVFADALLQARLAASKDPEGAALDRLVDSLGAVARTRKDAAE